MGEGGILLLSCGAKSRPSKSRGGQAKGSRTPRPQRGRALILASLSSPGERRVPLSVAPRTQKAKAGGPANNPFHKWERAFLRVKTRQKMLLWEKKANKHSVGQVLYVCASKIKPTRDEY